MVARSQREGDNANDYLLPGFTRLKALAAYRWLAFGARLNLQLNVDNLLNAHYFESVGETYSVMPGSPRRWLLSIGADL
jgi:iron complex outermembrane receptor protein